MTRGHYEVLGVARDASTTELRRAYLDLARRHHPDRPGGNADRMREVNEAWAVLGDAVRRERYDLSLREPPPAAAPSRPTRPDPNGRDPRYDPDDDLPEDLLRRWHLGLEDDDLLADLRDDRPLGRTVVLPQWAALAPPAALLAAVLFVIVGAVGHLAFLVAFGLALFVLAIVAFLAAPFVALLLARNPPDRPLDR